MTLLREHLQEQIEAHWRDFQKEWSHWGPKLAEAGMRPEALSQLKFRCWMRFLKRNGFDVDELLDEA